MPFGADDTLACPPPVNYAVRSLNSQFRDPATVLAATGRLEGNNTQVFRGATARRPKARSTAAPGSFDFPFNSAGSAETFLFFAMNFAHDFFYDLGFDEAGRQLPGRQLRPRRARRRSGARESARARTQQRELRPRADGNSPTINMFLWDGNGCWGEDVDGDGFPDLDGDYDLDIIVHEYHHGVSLRLNTGVQRERRRARSERAAATSSPTASTTTRRSPNTRAQADSGA